MDLAGWLSYIIASLVSVIYAYSDFKKYGLRPSKLKFYVLFIALFGALFNTVYTPFDKIKAQKEIKHLKESIALLDSQTASLHSQNKIFTEQNKLLKDQINYTSQNLNKYKGQIQQFSINFSTFFVVQSPIDISSMSLISHPDPTYARISRTDTGFFFSFQTSDNSYSFTPVRRMNNSIMYAFQIKSDVKNGNNPIGQSMDILKQYSIIQLFIPSFGNIPKNDFQGRKVKILNCSVNFTINGKNLPMNKINCPSNLESFKGQSIYGDQKDWFTIEFKTPKSIYEIYSLNKF